MVPNATSLTVNRVSSLKYFLLTWHRSAQKISKIINLQLSLCNLQSMEPMFIWLSNISAEGYATQFYKCIQFNYNLGYVVCTNDEFQKSRCMMNPVSQHCSVTSKTNNHQKRIRTETSRTENFWTEKSGLKHFGTETSRTENSWTEKVWTEALGLNRGASKITIENK